VRPIEKLSKDCGMSTRDDDALDRRLDDQELEQDRQMIDHSRESIGDADRHTADSVDRLVESQKLLKKHREAPELGPESLLHG
jgi:hypothetical protein